MYNTGLFTQSLAACPGRRPGERTRPARRFRMKESWPGRSPYRTRDRQLEVVSGPRITSMATLTPDECVL